MKITEPVPSVSHGEVAFRRRPRTEVGMVRRLGFTFFLNYGALAILLVGLSGELGAQDWRGANRAPAGLAPDLATTREAVVQVYEARATQWRGYFGVHTWIAVKPAGASAFTVYELIGYPPAVLGTFPSLYELLPRPRHQTLIADQDGTHTIDVMDPAEWERRGWGLASPDQDKIFEQLLPDVSDRAVRRRIARDYLEKSLRRARQFQDALDVPARPPAGTTISLVAGDALATPSVMTIGPNGLPLVFRYAAGDGVVTRSSALMDERAGRPLVTRLVSPIAWDKILFISAGHRDMTAKPEFIDNMLHQLLEAPEEPVPANRQ